mmetsp:Transcript_16327/g.24605  ORF Transcript_16327/g.24605 Transcript_16327/m.24605 type:complete len:119 (-) Transcript_16327:131-487(-)|eukprot:CAMPEP_0185017290 /NCGR_PEP_ID=MMETSP1103-20130426/264_1 /TAXON_ID=36769 /ORGANISM="Paraphysomonas bandaiensis, Strain Caron Lab Isolate" /LENGTH=118 /DNA_ID=CAMNT_0027546621 /DNA_START=57 /DNA_END=413 /DNA_ORIENTATION=+
MPFIRCVYSGDVKAKDDIMVALSSALSAALHKPEAVVMCHVEHTSSLCFGGSTEPCCMIQIESVGGDFESLITPFSDVMSSIGGVLPNRIFMNFRDVSADNWSIHGVTVAQFRENQSH